MSTSTSSLGPGNTVGEVVGRSVGGMATNVGACVVGLYVGDSEGAFVGEVGSRVGILVGT